MRYFKYKNTNKNFNTALKEQYKALIADEKRTARKKRSWESVGMTVSCIVFFACAILGIWLITLIPEPSGWFWRILVLIGEVMLGFVVVIISGFLTINLTKPLWKKAHAYYLPAMKKEIFSKACGHLRAYYDLQEPYIITKCFDASDKAFKNHDVCIFVVGNELRITTDLMRGFLYGERDLGCYAFRKDEILLSKQQDGNRLISKLKAGNTVFLLGYRAKGFIEKNFTVK